MGEAKLRAEAAFDEADKFHLNGADNVDAVQEMTPEQKAAQNAAIMAQVNMERQLQHYARINELKAAWLAFAEVFPQGSGLLRIVMSDHPIGVPNSMPTPHQMYVTRTIEARALAQSLINACDMVDKMDAEAAAAAAAKKAAEPKPAVN